MKRVKWGQMTLDQKIETAQTRIKILERELNSIKYFARGLVDAKEVLYSGEQDKKNLISEDHNKQEKANEPNTNSNSE